MATTTPQTTRATSIGEAGETREFGAVPRGVVREAKDRLAQR